MSRKLLGLLLAATMLLPMAQAFVLFPDDDRVLIDDNVSGSNNAGQASDTYVSADGSIVSSYGDGTSGCRVARSPDGGTTWSAATAIGGNGGCPMVQVSGTEYLVLGGSLYRSTDSGATWAVRSTVPDGCAGSPSRYHAMTLKADKLGLMVVWGGGSGGTDDLCGAYSADAGATWGAMFIILNTGSGSIDSISLAHRGSTWFFIYGGGYFTSTDNGATWSAGVALPGGVQNGLSKRIDGDECLCFFHTALQTVGPNQGQVVFRYWTGSAFAETVVVPLSSAVNVAAGASSQGGKFHDGRMYGIVTLTNTGDPLTTAQRTLVFRGTPTGAVGLYGYANGTLQTIANPALAFDAEGNAHMTGKQTSGTSNHYYFGGLILVDEEPTIPEPSEFDSGLLTIITGLGFVTPESQFFFSLILIGIVTVTTGVLLKFMAPSRMKLILVVSLAAAAGVFCVVLAMFDLWMYVLAIVIAGTIVKGSGEVRNTWHEIQQNFAHRSRTLAVDAADTPTAMPDDSFNRLVAADQAKEAATQAKEDGGGA